MDVSDPTRKSEIIRADWRTLPRGAKHRDLSAVDVMIDIDEVLMPTIDSIHLRAYEAGLHDNSEPMKTWAGYEQYGCPPGVYWDLWSDFALQGGYLTTPPIPGSVEALRRLYWEGHRIHLVTARGFMQHADEIRTWTPEWVETFAIPYHTLCFARDKVAIQGDLGVRFDYGADDSPKNFNALYADGVSMYLVNHPHNAEADIPPERRVDSLDEVVDTIIQEVAS